MSTPFNTARRTYPGAGGFGLHGSGRLGAVNTAEFDTAALDQVISAREERVQFLLRHGEIFYLPVALGLGTTPSAGSTFQAVTTSVDFDLLIIGAECTIFKSTIDIRDSARQRLLTNSPTPIGAIADFAVSGSLTMNRNYWRSPYLLPARSQFAITTTADGTESNGTLTFYCLQPPVYNS